MKRFQSPIWDIIVSLTVQAFDINIILILMTCEGKQDCCKHFA